MDFVPTVFAVSLVVLTIILSVVGVQLVLVLSEIRKSIKKANDAIDAAEAKFNAVIAPIQKIAGLAAGLGTGIKAFETFVQYLHRDKGKDEDCD